MSKAFRFSLGRTQTQLLVQRIRDGLLFVQGRGARIVLEVWASDSERSPARSQLPAELHAQVPHAIQMLVRNVPEAGGRRRSRSRQPRPPTTRWYLVVPFHKPFLERMTGHASRDAIVSQLALQEQRLARILLRGGVRVRSLRSGEIEELFYHSYARSSSAQRSGDPIPASATITVPGLDPMENDELFQHVYEMKQPELEIQRDHMVALDTDRLYMRALCLEPPREVIGAGWLSDVAGGGVSFDLSVHLQPRGSTSVEPPPDLDFPLEEVESKKPWRSGDRKRYRLGMYVMPYAATLADLELATEAIEERLAGRGVSARVALNRQLDGFLSVLPHAVDRLGCTTTATWQALGEALSSQAASSPSASSKLRGAPLASGYKR